MAKVTREIALTGCALIEDDILEAVVVGTTAVRVEFYTIFFHHWVLKHVALATFQR